MGSDNMGKDTYYTNEKTTFHYDRQTEKYTKVFRCCNIKTLFYSDGEILTDGTEILTYTPIPAILSNLYKYRQYGTARNGQKYLGSAGMAIQRKVGREDIKRGHLALKAQREYKNAKINGITKYGSYILPKNDEGEILREKNKIIIRGNPKKIKTGQFKQEFPNHRERRKVSNSFEPNRYSEKHKHNRAEVEQQIILNREKQKRIGLMIRK